MKHGPKWTRCVHKVKRKNSGVNPYAVCTTSVGSQQKSMEADVDVSKSGEGSRGGHVIGHTSTGKPIYENAGHKGHKDFTGKEHHEAYVAHHKRQAQSVYSDHPHEGHQKEAHREKWEAHETLGEKIPSFDESERKVKVLPVGYHAQIDNEKRAHLYHHLGSGHKELVDTAHSKDIYRIAREHAAKKDTYHPAGSPLKDRAKKSGGDMDVFKSLGIVVGERSLINMTKGNDETFVDAIKKGGFDTARKGTYESPRERLVDSIPTQEAAEIQKSFAVMLSAKPPVEAKDEYAKEDDEGDEWGGKYLKNTHAEMVHDDNDKELEKLMSDAHETDHIHGIDEQENPAIRYGVGVRVTKDIGNVRMPIKRSLTQEELFLKASEACEDLSKAAVKGPLKEFIREEEEEGGHSKESLKKLKDFDKEEEGEEEHSKKSSLDSALDDLTKGLFYEPKKDDMLVGPYEPKKADFLMQLGWKLKELQELKNSSWFIEREAPECKEMAEKLYSKLKRDLNDIVEKYGKAKKSFAEDEKDAIQKAYMGFKEVERKVAQGGASDPGAVAAAIGRKKYGKKKFQEAAAAGHKMGHKTKKASDEMDKDFVQYSKKSALDELVDVVKGDSLIEMIEDSHDPETVKHVHENSNFNQPPNAQKSFVKAVGPGGMVFDFGAFTGNPVADRATILLNQHSDPRQVATTQYQRASYEKALVDYTVKGELGFNGRSKFGDVDGGWDKQFDKSTDQQVVEAYKSGALVEDRSAPAVKNEFNKSELHLGGEVIKATSETDAAIIEMMKAEQREINSGGIIADATHGGKIAITADAVGVKN